MARCVDERFTSAGDADDHTAAVELYANGITVDDGPNYLENIQMHAPASYTVVLEGGRIVMQATLYSSPHFSEL